MCRNIVTLVVSNNIIVGNGFSNICFFESTVESIVLVYHSNVQEYCKTYGLSNIIFGNVVEPLF